MLELSVSVVDNNVSLCCCKQSRYNRRYTVYCVLETISHSIFLSEQDSLYELACSLFDHKVTEEWKECL